MAAIRDYIHHGSGPSSFENVPLRLRADEREPHGLTYNLFDDARPVEVVELLRTEPPTCRVDFDVCRSEFAFE